MDKNKIIQEEILEATRCMDINQMKFHVNAAKRLLLELHLKPYNIDKEALDIIAESFDTLLLNLESELSADTKYVKTRK